MCPAAVYYENSITHSPPMFSHSPPPSSMLMDTILVNHHHHHHQYSNSANNKNNTNSNSFNSGTTNFPRLVELQTAQTPQAVRHAAPRRSCLAVAPPPTTADNSKPQKKKKSVVFADDRGMSLTHVRILQDNLNAAAAAATFYLRCNGYKTQTSSSSQPTPPRWTLKFVQPAVDFVAFRRRIDAYKVCLEAATVDETHAQLVGTVKVRNLAYEKLVTIRATTDEWYTFRDTACTYQQQQPTSPITALAAPYSVYDTFTFQVDIGGGALKSPRIEFCVRFRCDGREFWDNNYGQNYTVVQAEAELSYDQNNNRTGGGGWMNFNATKWDNSSSSLGAMKLMDREYGFRPYW